MNNQPEMLKVRSKTGRSRRTISKVIGSYCRNCIGFFSRNFGGVFVVIAEVRGDREGFIRDTNLSSIKRRVLLAFFTVVTVSRGCPPAVICTVNLL